MPRPNMLTEAEQERDQDADECERYLLSVILQAPACFAEVAPRLHAHDFWLTPHRALYALMCERFSHGESLDLVQMSGAMAGDSAAYGGLSYVTDLFGYAPSRHMDVDHLIGRIRERRLRRYLLETAHALEQAARGQEPTLNGDVVPDAPDAAAMHVSMFLLEIASATEHEAREWSSSEAAYAAFLRRDEARQQGRPARCTTGMSELDELLAGGLARKELTFIAARPSVGKTALALGCASDQARSGLTAGLVSLEMDYQAIGDRELARISGFPLHEIMQGRWDSHDDLNGWREAMTEWRDRYRIHDPSRIDVGGIVAKAHEWVARYGLDVLYVDYLTLVKHPKRDRHDLAVGATAAALKALAKDLNLAVVVLAQLNREIEKDRPKTPPPMQHTDWWLDVPTPHPGHLRDSGEIEQHADVILFPLRAEVCGFSPGDAGVRSAACIKVAKNRNGRTGFVPARWHGPTASYFDSDAAAEPGLV